MPDRRGRKGALTFPIVHDKAWAEEIWRDRKELAHDFGLLRKAASILRLDDDHVAEELGKLAPRELRGNIDQ